MGSRTLWGTGSEGVGKAEPGEKKPAADAGDGSVPVAVSTTAPKTGSPTENTAGSATENTTGSAAPLAPRPTRLTPGGSALAALLTQNRAKADKPDGAEASGAVPRPRRATPSGGTFDLLEITGVGSAAVEQKVDVADATGSGGMRLARLTPGGGLPALLAGAVREAGNAGEPDAKLAFPRPTRVTPTEDGFASLAITAVGGAVVEKKSVTGEHKVDVAAPDGGGPAGAPGGGTQDPSAPRPTRLTPGSGGLAALLAQTRSRTGKHDILEKKNPVASLGPDDSGARPAGILPAEPTVPTASASLPQKKNPNFAATLMGVPAPEIIVQRPAVVVGQPVPSEPSVKVDAPRPRKTGQDRSTIFGRDRHLPTDASGNRAQSAPDSMAEGEPTEKNLEISGDVADLRARRVLDERQRTTDVVDVVKETRGPRFAIGTMVGAALVLVAVVLIVPRIRKPKGQDSRAVPGATTESSPPAAQPAAPIPAADPATAAPKAGTAEQPEVPAAPGVEEATAKDEAQNKARLEAEAAKAAKAEAKEKARAEVAAAKATKAEGREKARAEAKAAKVAKDEAQKQARAEAKAAKVAKDEAQKQARSQAKAAKAGTVDTQKQARAEAKAAKAAKEEAEKQARAEVRAAKAAKDEAQKQARAEARAAKAAKEEAQKPTRAEAKAAKATKEEAQTGARPGLPWETAPTEPGPSVAARPEPRRPASVNEAPKVRPSPPPKLMEDPDGTLPLSTR